MLTVSAWFSILWFLLALIALWSKYEVMGQAPPAQTPLKKKSHTYGGWAYLLILFAFIAYMLLRLERFGPPQGLWMGLHAYLGFAILALALLKIAVVKKYKKYLSSAPAIGTALFCLTLVLVGMSGFWRLTSQLATPSGTVTYREKKIGASVGLGKKVVYLKCARCHDLKPVFLLQRTEREWEPFIVRMQDKDKELMTEEDCANSLLYLSTLKH